MASNFFWIGYHFEKLWSQVATRKKINFTPWIGYENKEKMSIRGLLTTNLVSCLLLLSYFGSKQQISVFYSPAWI